MTKLPSDLTTPFRADEFPELLGKYRRLLNIGFIASFIVVMLPGYLSYFSNLQTSSSVAHEIMHGACDLCSARYTDLQRYDGISGSVYLAVMPLAIGFSAILYLALFLMYLRLWRKSDQHMPLPKGAVRSTALTLVLFVGIFFAIVALPTNLSGSPYSGTFIWLTAPFYPFLAGISTIILSLALLHISVFVLKLLVKRNKRLSH
jgi:hypothetical protein